MKRPAKLADRLAEAERSILPHMCTFTDARTGRPLHVPILDVLGTINGRCSPESKAKIARADVDAQESMLSAVAVQMAQGCYDHEYGPCDRNYNEPWPPQSQPQPAAEPEPHPAGAGWETQLTSAPEPDPAAEPEPEPEAPALAPADDVESSQLTQAPSGNYEVFRP
ncbi:hypothetical protein GCM10009854_27870 [Saccharopolyspora halophila]|uniref:Uncharacterized protein n=1 Tax=Saccharopolyspora halophila TaxID=405551 RepID=A0ABN3GD01_9PSEU